MTGHSAGDDDVAVVGGGPAGALAGLLLARRGWQVRLFDRARFPRPKLCGDTLNPGALAVLARHLDLAPLAAMGHPIRGMRLSGPGGVAVCGTYPDGITGLGLARADLDAWLLGEAVRAGVAVCEAASVSGTTISGGQVSGVRLRSRGGEAVHSARLVVAADGRASTLAAGLGLAVPPRQPRRWAMGAYLSGVTGVRADYGEMHVRDGRYLGIAPMPSGLANVCLVVPYAVARTAMRDPAGAVLQTARRDPWTASRFTNAELASPAAVLGPMAMDVPVPGAPGLLLAGDAAGFIDPMTGDGIRLALAGAEFAADVADAVLCGRLAAADAATVLARRRRQAFRAKWTFNRAVRSLVASRALSGATALARCWPRAFEAMVCYAGDVGAAAPVEATCPSR